MEALYDYVFWINPYENMCYAIPREKYLKFFNGHENKKDIDGVIQGKDINVLIEHIINVNDRPSVC